MDNVYTSVAEPRHFSLLVTHNCQYVEWIHCRWCPPSHHIRSDVILRFNVLVMCKWYETFSNMVRYFFSNFFGRTSGRSWRQTWFGHCKLNTYKLSNSTEIATTVRRLHFATAVFALFPCEILIKFYTQWQF